MKRAALALSLGMLLASPAMATEWVSCASPGGEASFDYLAGAMDVISVVGLNISVGEQVWASDVAYGPGDPVVVGQAFEDAETVRIDAMDADMINFIARLRLFKAASADGADAYGGTLDIPGHGTWPVACSPS
jgi:hypothetical protein